MCLLVAYDGHHYHGWQRQLNDASVQVTLEKAITEMNGAYAKVRGASRTDAGVHALGQAAAFDASRSIPMNGWKYGLNQLLPRDIAVIDARACELGYNPRYRARSKVYRYLVLDSDTRIPWWADRAWYLGSYYKSTRRTELNADAMQQALDLLYGTHSFHAFRASDDVHSNTIRTLTKVRLSRAFAGEENLWSIEIEGTAFLKNMVRIIVGTLVEVGSGRRSVESVSALLGSAGNRGDAGPTAPAHGLTLVRVNLEGHGSL